MSGRKSGGKPWNSDFWLAELSKLSNDHALKSECWETTPPKEPKYTPKEEPDKQKDEEEDIPSVDDIHVDWTLDDEKDNVKEQPKPSPVKAASPVIVSPPVKAASPVETPQLVSLDADDIQPSSWKLFPAPMVPIPVNNPKTATEPITETQPNPPVAAAPESSQPTSPSVSKLAPANESSLVESSPTLSVHETPTILSPLPSPVPQSSSPVSTPKESHVSPPATMKSPPASLAASVQETSATQSVNSSPVSHPASVKSTTWASAKDLPEWTPASVPEWDPSSVQIVPEWTPDKVKQQPSLWQPPPPKAPVVIKHPAEETETLWQPPPASGPVSIKPPTETTERPSEPPETEKPVSVEAATEATDKLWEPPATKTPISTKSPVATTPVEPATETVEAFWEPPAKVAVSIKAPTQGAEKVWQPAATKQPISIKPPPAVEQVWQPAPAKKPVIIKPPEEIWQPAKSKRIELKPASPVVSNASPINAAPIFLESSTPADARPAPPPGSIESSVQSVTTPVDRSSATATPVSKSMDGVSVHTEQNESGPSAAVNWTTVDECEVDESGSEYETDSDASVEQITINLASLVKSTQMEKKKHDVPVIHCSLTDLILGTKSARIREIIAQLSGEKSPSENDDASGPNLDENRTIGIPVSSVDDTSAHQAGSLGKDASSVKDVSSEKGTSADESRDPQNNAATSETLDANGSSQQHEKKAEVQRTAAPTLNAFAPSFTPKFAMPQANDEVDDEEEEKFVYEPSYDMEDGYIDHSSSAALHPSSSLFSPPTYFDSSDEPGYVQYTHQYATTPYVSSPYTTYTPGGHAIYSPQSTQYSTSGYSA